MGKKKHKLELTDTELIALVEILDSFSAISDGIMDEGEAKRDLKKVDAMLLKNGFKREYK